MSDLRYASASTREEFPATSSGLPPGPKLLAPKFRSLFWYRRTQVIDECVRRYGDMFTLTVPVYGRSVVVASPEHARQVFTAANDEMGCSAPNLGGLLGSSSVFALDGSEHRRRRRLLTPMFHGKSCANFEQIFVEETLRECEGWPTGQPFAVLPSATRISLEVMLRVVFGANGDHLNELRQLVPPLVQLGSRLAVLPVPRFIRRRVRGHRTPWGRFRERRQAYHDAIGRLVENVKADPEFDTRTDILSLLLRAVYDDGSAMTPKEIADELLTLLAAGHETTAATLAWAFERITRHRDVLDKVTAEAMTDGNEYRRAVIAETLRSRPVIALVGRKVHADSFELGDWSIPCGATVMIALSHLHNRAEDFPDPQRFDPQRFIGKPVPSHAWLPFGGGTRRCLGSVFASLEIDVILRTVLRHFSVEPATAADERVDSGGVALTPKDGAKIVVHRREDPAAGVQR
ncbi:cytochrome P450 [Mycobacterium sp. SMC-15]|uniref:cytochrome P450 n=1 Tax=Mycobacterium sp. SMC-15 TaxID=3381627 RepID=UPI00387759C3